MYRTLVYAIEYKPQTEKCMCGQVRVGRNVHCEIMELFGNRSLELRCVCLHLRSAPAANRAECD